MKSGLLVSDFKTAFDNDNRVSKLTQHKNNHASKLNSEVVMKTFKILIVYNCNEKMFREKQKLLKNMLSHSFYLTI